MLPVIIDTWDDAEQVRWKQMKILKLPRGTLIKIFACFPQQILHRTVRKQPSIADWCCARWFNTCANAFHLHDNPEVGTAMHPIYRQPNWGTEKLSNLPKVTQLVSDRAWIKPSNLAPESVLSSPTESCLYGDDSNIYVGDISKISVW